MKIGRLRPAAFSAVAVQLLVLITGCRNAPAAHPRPDGFIVATSGSPAGDGSETNPWDLETALAHPAVLRPGDTVWVRGGVYRGAFESTVSGTASAPIVLRPYPREVVTLDGSLTVRGGHSVFRGFEITNSDTRRFSAEAGSNPLTYVRLGGVSVHGPGVRLINLIVHDAGGGVGMSAGAVDAEVYGCLIYYNGWEGPDRGHGHGIYAQNLTGTKRIVDNIVSNQFGYGLHVFGSEQAPLRGFHIEGNVLFDNGTLARERDAFDILIGGGQPAEQVVVRSNYTYRRDVKPIARFGFGIEVPNRDATVTDNYFVGLTEFRPWQHLTVTGNTFIGGPFLIHLQLPDSDALARYVWRDNTYFADPDLPSDGGGLPFYLVAGAQRRGFEFAAWRAATGLDAGSRFQRARPTGVTVFVRPNRYEDGRAHVIVYNWDRAGAVDVDLAGVLQPGDAYEIRDAQDPLGPPLLSGTGTGLIPRLLAATGLGSRGTTLTLPLTRAAMATPVGTVPTPPPPTVPEFRVFLITRVER